MTPEEQLICIKAGLYCTLTNTNPQEYVDSLGSECQQVMSDIINYVENIKCSDLTKTIFVKNLLKQLKQLENQILTTFQTEKGDK